MFYLPLFSHGVTFSLATLFGLVQTLYCCDRFPSSLHDGHLQVKYKHGYGFVSGRVHEGMRAWSGMGGDGASKGSCRHAIEDALLHGSNFNLL
ncbi:uncharacterized protein BKA55DRAFT_249391 [Fusarium redolens]|jgi:hypothetical protein|uniref:Uncharacterized protein n=1 Tax=Fusarium redolens TaxID=48865 RepID=A0A9P9HY49_FUSRE|nr:uncharacterized protein BKA55DRAFT_249391 [Fusarium redolens]KAH7265371.1 hypothetical protein BKA55DRAFT_249391 [Fusarium redolens]